jgi:hypothetical protein
VTNEHSEIPREVLVNDPLDPVGLREMARVAAETGASIAEKDPLDPRSISLSIVAAIYNVGATIGEQVRLINQSLNRR